DDGNDYQQFDESEGLGLTHTMPQPPNEPQLSHRHPDRDSPTTRLLYGCGLRVSEPLEFRIKDVNLEGTQFVIRGAKGGKDRVVQIPCSVIEDVRQQVESARTIWKKNALSKTPIALPHQ